MTTQPQNEATLIRVRILRGGKVVRSYKVHADSLTIGSGTGCTIRVAGDTSLKAKHVSVYFDDGALALVPEPGAQVTLNGLGEKTGNADLAETVIAAELYGIPSAVNMKKLYGASKMVEEISKIPISPLKPVVGENVFKRESGVTAAQLISYPPAVEGYSPEVLGREREVLLSKKSGKRSVEYKLEKLNVSATAVQVDEVLKRVKELGVRKRGLVTDDEFREIVKEVLKSPK